MPTFLPAIRRWCIAFAALYSLLIFALSLLWSFGTQQVWWAEVSNIFAPYAFLPLLLFVPAALLINSRWLRGLVAALVLLFVLLFGGQLLPRAPREESADGLRVVTFNQLASNKRADDVIAAIRAQHADVVALQELSPRVAAAAHQQLAGEYPFQLLQPATDPSGLGVLSRYPLEPQPVAPGTRYQHVVLKVGVQSITLFNAHPHVPRVRLREGRVTRPWLQRGGYDTSIRAQELNELLGAIDRTAGPLLVVGDFNLSDREQMYAAFDARLHDAFRETSWGFGHTFPKNGRFGSITIPVPLVRIDYIWSGGGIMPLETNVNCADVGSDHCMLVASVAFSG